MVLEEELEIIMSEAACEDFVEFRKEYEGLRGIDVPAHFRVLPQ